MRSSLLTALLAASLGLTACASQQQQLPGADPQLTQLAKHAARKMDKPTLLEIGKRYEYGIGVPVNWQFAAQFYYAAAMDVRGGVFGTSNGIPMNVQAPIKGLPEAKARLAALRAKMKAAGYKCSGSWPTKFGC
jgi:TPR repeat protein